MLLIVLSLVSCRATKQLTAEVPIKTTTTVTEHLVPVTIPADSSTLRALFSCDSTNQVIMTMFSENKSGNVSSTYSLNKGTLIYKTKIQHDSIFVPAKDSVVYQQVPIKVPVSVVTNKLNGFQNILVWSGGILWLVFIGYGATKLIKLYLKFK